MESNRSKPVSPSYPNNLDTSRMTEAEIAATVDIPSGFKKSNSQMVLVTNIESSFLANDNGHGNSVVVTNDNVTC